MPVRRTDLKLVEMLILSGLWAPGLVEADPGVRAWPFYLALAIWVGVVLVHGSIQAGKEGSSDAG